VVSATADLRVAAAKMQSDIDSPPVISWADH